MIKRGRGRPAKPLAERLWARVNRDGPTQPHMTTPCWEWTGYRNRDGYGMICPDRQRTNQMNAHRAAWVTVNGPIPDGLHVLHRCDNRACVRAEPGGKGHLFLGTNRDNVLDAVRKGRHSVFALNMAHRGEANRRAALKAVDIPIIRWLVNEQGVSRAAVAACFGVSRSTVGEIAIGATWRDV